MPFCTNCGTRVDGAKFCPNCGTKVADACEPAAPPPCPRGAPAPQRPSDMVSHEKKEEMVGVTGAVRSYTANASAEEKERKYGQQKWGLFETDYQRRKGITTEQSLQEIEDFCANGGEVCAPHPSAKPGDGPFGGTPARPAAYDSSYSGSSSGGYYSSGPEARGLNPNKFGSGGGAPGYGHSTAPGYGHPAPPPQRVDFGPGGNAGADYFRKHQEAEAAKYRPGYRGPK